MNDPRSICLTLVSEEASQPWLSYILDRFKSIQKAEFQIQIGSEASEGPILYHGTAPANSLSMPAESNRRVFSVEQAQAILEEESIRLPYDLLRQAFIALSRLEEYDCQQAGKKIQSYSSRHPNPDKTRFDKPYVNLLFGKLETLLRSQFPELSFGEKEKPVLDFSHDLDYIKKTIQLRLKQTAFNKYNTFKSIGSWTRFKRNFIKTFSFFYSHPSYWCFDYWDELEKSHDQRSTYYVYAHTGSRGLKSWLLDPSYDVSSNKELQDKLKSLNADGHRIGLHGSFASAEDPELLRKEKETLEKALGLPITLTRQHWLRYDEGITPQVHEELFKEDATLGWNDRMGYRASCASQYHPYDHKNEQAFTHLETPTIIMDSNIYDYGAQEVEALGQKALEMIKELGHLKSAHVAISWHPRVCSSDYNWHPVYEQLIKARH